MIDFSSGSELSRSSGSSSSGMSSSCFAFPNAASRLSLASSYTSVRVSCMR
jgi:hypothetical protein